MINTKRKRKLEYMGNNYYWYVKCHDSKAKVHIISEDKKIQLCCNPFDTEVPVTPKYVMSLIKCYLEQ